MSELGADLREYLALTRDLQRHFDAGTDDSPEADALRARMDGPSARLTQAEAHQARLFSADLETVAGEPAPTEPPTPEERAAFTLALSDALYLLHFKAQATPSRSAALRSAAWRVLGDDSLAQQLQDLADRLEGQDEAKKKRALADRKVAFSIRNGDSLPSIVMKSPDRRKTL